MSVTKLLLFLVLDLIGLNESVIFFWINHIAEKKTKNNPKIVCKTQIIEKLLSVVTFNLIW